MFERSHIFQGAVIIVILLSGFASAAPPKKNPQWHVKQAEIRIPVNVTDQFSMPRTVYLADLKPVKNNGVSIDKEKGSLWASSNKTVTYSLDSRFRYVKGVLHRGGWVKILAENKILGVRSGPSGRKGAKTTSFNFAIPKGTKKLTVNVNKGGVHALGLTTGPEAARVQYYMPDNPTDYTPVVFSESGKRVSCRVVHVAEGDPVLLVFDCSSEDKKYFIYPLHKRYKINSTNWTPKSLLTLETRYLNGPSRKYLTHKGYEDLWKNSSVLAGRNFFDSMNLLRYPSFPTLHEDQRAPLTPSLTRITGHFYVHSPGDVRIYSRLRPGGYLLVDGKMFLNCGDSSHGKRDDCGTGRIVAGKSGKVVKFTKGLHSYDLLLYSAADYNYTAFSFFGTPEAKQPHLLLPAVTTVDPAENRDGKKPQITVSWAASFVGTDVKQAMAKWPSSRMAAWPLKAAITGYSGNVVFRWKLCDGRVLQGESVMHTYFKRGVYPVTVEALKGSKGSVLARLTVPVRINFSRQWGNRGINPFEKEWISRLNKSGKTMAVEHVIDIHAYSRDRYHRPLQKQAAGVLASRIDEVIKARQMDVGYLTWLAKHLSAPPESQHQAALKLYNYALRALEPGDPRRKTLVIQIADLLTGVFDKPSEAIDLIEKNKTQKDPIKIDRDWQMASTEGSAQIPEKINPKTITSRLKWERMEALSSVSHLLEEDEVLWLKKTFNLSGRSKGRPLHQYIGNMPKNGMIYCNNKPVCPTWQCFGEYVAIPANYLKNGSNELMFRVGPGNPDDFKNKHFTIKLETTVTEREFKLARAKALLYQDKPEEVRPLLVDIGSTKILSSLPMVTVDGWYCLGPVKEKQYGKNYPSQFSDVNIDKPFKGKKWRLLDGGDYLEGKVDVAGMVSGNESVFLYKKFSSEQQYTTIFEMASTRPGCNAKVWFNKGTAQLGHIGHKNKLYSKREGRVRKGVNELLVQVYVTKPQEGHNFKLAMKSNSSAMTDIALAAQLRRAKRLADEGEVEFADRAYEDMQGVLELQPIKMLEVDIMETMVRILLGREDYVRALVLSKHLINQEPPEIHQRKLLWSQVQANLGMDDIDAAKDVYYKCLKKDYPYAEETLWAKEALIDRMLEEKKKSGA